MDEQLLYSWQFSAECLAKQGLNVSEIFKQQGIDLEHLQGSEENVSLSAWHAILDDAVRISGDPDLGLKYCREADFSGYGPIGFAMLSAETLGQGVEIICRYLDLVQGGTETLIEQDEGVLTLTFRSLDAGLLLHRTDIDMNISFIIELIRYCVGPDWSPIEVHFMYSQPDNISAYKTIVGAPVFFGAPINKVLLSAEVLDAPMPRADHRLCDILCRDLDRLLADSVRNRGKKQELLDSVRSEVAKLLCRGAPKIEDVAKRLNTSSRSLQRRLSDEDYSFKVLVEDTRRQLAENYIRSTNHSLTDIAFMLGYSEISAFTRAFRRWCGITPQKFRNQA